MQITKGRFFGIIIQSCDAHSAKMFHQYYIGRRPGKLLFDGVAGDENEALETVNAYLEMLTSRLRSENRTRHTISSLLNEEPTTVPHLYESTRN